MNPESEVRLGRVHGLFFGRAFDRPFNSEVWTVYAPLVVRKSRIYFLCEVFVPLSLLVHQGKPDIDALRRSVVSEGSFFVRIRSAYRSFVLGHYAFCALRYDRLAKEYHLVLVFPCKVSDNV